MLQNELPDAIIIFKKFDTEVLLWWAAISGPLTPSPRQCNPAFSWLLQSPCVDVGMSR